MEREEEEEEEEEERESVNKQHINMGNSDIPDRLKLATVK